MRLASCGRRGGPGGLGGPAAADQPFELHGGDDILKPGVAVFVELR